MGRMEPSWLCDLLDGLEGVDGSLYRAWMAEHHPLLREDAKSMPRLSYLTYGQSQMLMLSMTNQLEMIRVMIARMMGDQEVEAAAVYPPGTVVKPDSVGPKSFSTAGKSFAQITGILGAVFGGNSSSRKPLAFHEGFSFILPEVFSWPCIPLARSASIFARTPIISGRFSTRNCILATPRSPLM